MNDRPRVLIIYTGGTIGMMADPRTGALRPMDLEHLEEHVPELERIDVKLDAVSFDQPIDSSDMRPVDHVRIAGLIGTHYHDHDGFVVLHATPMDHRLVWPWCRRYPCISNTACTVETAR